MTALWVASCLATLIWLERFHAPRTFFFDEWNFIFDRRTGTVDDFLAPHNGHLSAVPVAVYKVSLWLFGMDHYRPLRLLGLLTHVLVATAAYRYIRARLGGIVGISGGFAILLLGSGWQNIFWPFQVGFMGSMLTGILAWLLLDRDDRRADVGASACLGIALACSGLGIALMVGTVARLAVDRSWVRLAKVAAPPTALYLVWYVAYGQSQGKSDNVSLIPRFVANEAASSAAGIFGRSVETGRWLLVVMIVVAGVVAIVRRRRISSAVVAPLGAALTNWVLIGYSRADVGDYAASRYVYVGVILIILTSADLLRGITSRMLSGVTVMLSVLSVWGNWVVLHNGAASLRGDSEITRSELRATEWAAGTVSPEFRPDTRHMPQVAAGEYLAAERELGSAAATDAEVSGAGEPTREATDLASIGALRITLVPVAALPAPEVSSRPADGSRVSPTVDQCLALTKPAGTSERKLEIAVTGGSTLVLEASAEPMDVRLRRYADQLPNTPTATLADDQMASLTIPVDNAPNQTWIVDIRSQSDMKACVLPG